MRRRSNTSIFTELANKYEVPYQVVEVICRFPFRFTSERMQDANDMKDILFANLFRFKLKNEYKKNGKKPKSRNNPTGISGECSDMRELPVCGSNVNTMV